MAEYSSEDRQRSSCSTPTEELAAAKTMVGNTADGEEEIAPAKLADGDKLEEATDDKTEGKGESEIAAAEDDNDPTVSSDDVFDSSMDDQGEEVDSSMDALTDEKVPVETVNLAGKASVKGSNAQGNEINGPVNKRKAEGQTPLISGSASPPRKRPYNIANDHEEWAKWYLKLEYFKTKYGHCNVPPSQGPLAKWVASQRQNDKEKKLAPRRVLKLNYLGFNWGGIQEDLKKALECVHRIERIISENHDDLKSEIVKISMAKKWEILKFSIAKIEVCLKDKIFMRAARSVYVQFSAIRRDKAARVTVKRKREAMRPKERFVLDKEARVTVKRKREAMRPTRSNIDWRTVNAEDKLIRELDEKNALCHYNPPMVCVLIGSRSVHQNRRDNIRRKIR